MNRLFLLVLTSIALANQALAGTTGTLVSAKDWTWVGTISAGPVWASNGKAQTFFLAPETEKTYAARKSRNVLAAGELFLGVQNAWAAGWLGQWGLAAATTGNARLQGEIWDDADSRFNNHSYQYKISHSRVVVKGKLLLDKGYWILPWVSASLGVGFNQAHDFSNTPLIFEALPDANFTDRTKTSFTYTLGAGVQKPINEHWQVGIGYEFADWGKSSLGRALGQTLGTGLALNHLYTDGFLLNLTHVA